MPHQLFPRATVRAALRRRSPPPQSILYQNLLTARKSFSSASNGQSSPLQSSRAPNHPRPATQPRKSMSDASRNFEAAIKRNPHPDFGQVQASRPAMDVPAAWSWSKGPDPEWRPGDGASDAARTPAGMTEADRAKKHREIDPYAEGRPPALNYKLMISAIVPRFVGFLGTKGEDGSTNLAPFSYTTMVNHDPPVFVVGFASPHKHTCVNLRATRECTVNVISEHFAHAANYCSVDAPAGVSEWELSGLTPAPCSTVSAPRVAEAVFSVEGKLVEAKEFFSKGDPEKVSGVMCIIEGTRFWAREDAINEEGSLIDPNVLRPVSRLGGITYGRTVEGWEALRPQYEKEVAEGRVKGKESKV